MLSKKLIKAAAGNAAPAGYQISRSLRFNSADSAYLSRTPAGAGNRKTFTYSFWVKRSALAANQAIFEAGTGANNYSLLWFTSSDQLSTIEDQGAGGVYALTTTQVFRDVSWYHIVVAFDTTQATSTNRIKFYVNGVQVTAFGTASYPSQNLNTYVNAANAHRIGNRIASNALFNGYFADFFLVDGQALTPADFGETDATTGVWKPKEYTGTYGTNGFHLDFSDNTSTTTIGYDAAGSNDWTANNFSVTAGAGNDSLVDTPTPYGTDTGAGGEVRGNYCTINPLTFSNSTGGSISNGNLNFTAGSSNGDTRAWSTLGVSSGKWYFESTIVAVDGSYGTVGISDTILAPGQGFTVGNWWVYRYDGTKFNGANPSSSGSAYGASYTTNDVIGVAVDLDAGEITFYKNGSSQGVAYSNVTGTIYPAHYQWAANSQQALNFGQRPFAYTAPSGFKALCTQNLPDPTIVQGDDYFNTVLYTGNGSTQTITGVGFQPDWVWIKNRSGANSHQISDAIRGFTKYLFSDATLAEETRTNQITSVGADGFSLDNNTAVNNSGSSYVAWNWNAGGSNATNTDGTITSTVRANSTAGFSIVSWIASGVDATIGHGLGVAPSMIVAKRRDSTGNWAVQFPSIGNGYLLLNSTIAYSGADPSIWNATAPTSTVFSTAGQSAEFFNAGTFIAYCFAEVEGYSKFGSYVGNGSTDGPFVYANHRPAFIMIKRTNTTGNWTIIDTKREGYNVDNDPLYPNLSSAEGATDLADILSNGFKLRSTDASVNASGGTYIFMSLASNPFKYSLAR